MEQDEFEVMGSATLLIGTGRTPTVVSAFLREHDWREGASIHVLNGNLVISWLEKVRL